MLRTSLTGIEKQITDMNSFMERFTKVQEQTNANDERSCRSPDEFPSEG